MTTAIHAQLPDWIRTDSASKSNLFVSAIAANPDGGLTYLISRFNGTSYNDTLTLDTFRIPVNTNTSILAKVDSNGHVQKAIKCGNRNFNWYQTYMVTDNQGAIYIMSNTGGTLEDGKTKVNLMQLKVYVAKYDKDLNLKWVRQDFDNYQNYYGLYHTGNKLVFMVRLFNGSYTLGGNNFNFTGYNDHPVFGELDTSNGTILWVKNVFAQNLSVNQHISAVCFSNNRYYLYGGTMSKSILIGNDTLSANSYFIIRTDFNGVYQMSQCIKSSFKYKDSTPVHQTFGRGIMGVVADNSGLYFTNYQHGDTLYFDSDTLFPQAKTSAEQFVFSLNPNLGFRWIYKPEFKDSNTGFFGSLGLGVKNGIVYCPMTFAGKLKLDSAVYKAEGQRFLNLVLLLSTLGKLQHSFTYSTGYSNSSNVSMRTHGQLEVSPKRGIYLVAQFADTAILGDSVRIHDNSEFLVWSCRLLPVSLKRGKVLPGPYCAGDTIYIPYTVKGFLDSSNYFMAELSDENGEFKNKWYHLGSLKANKDSVIIGVLPLLDIVSSDKYRIRVRSTHDLLAVSPYRLDTLRFLVYSRDTANAGPDQTICLGQSVSLQVTGGTVWRWSPGNLLNDSTSRIAVAKPLENTRFRVVISDTSGCGMQDTAYKNIFVLHAKSRLTFNDSTGCSGDTIKLRADFYGGDSNSYSWKWWKKANQSITIVSSGSGKTFDEISDVIQQDSVTYFISVQDVCALKPDTQSLEIRSAKALQLEAISDQWVCSGSRTVVIPEYTGGEKSSMIYLWKNDADSVISTEVSLIIFPEKNDSFQLKISDRCLHSDSAYFKINVRPPLSVSLTGISANDSLCANDVRILKASATGGDTAKYRFEWFVNDSFAGAGDSFLLKSPMLNSGVQFLTVIINDDCTVTGDTFTLNFYVHEPVTGSIRMSQDSLCYGDSLLFEAIVTGPEMKYPYQWYLNSDQLSDSGEKVYWKYTDSLLSGSRLIRLTYLNACTGRNDSVAKTLYLRKPLFLEFANRDSCFKAGSVLRLNSSGGNPASYFYTWYFNGQWISNHTDSLILPVFTDPVKYVVIVQDGCSAPPDTAVISVFPIPSTVLNINSHVGCEPFVLSATANSSNGNGFVYSFGFNQNYTTFSTDSLWIDTLQKGKYIPRLVAKSTAGCMDSVIGKEIVIYESPTADFSWNPQNPSPIFPDIQFANLSKGANRYQWDFGQFGGSSAVRPRVQMNMPGDWPVILIATNTDGCTDTALRMVKVFHDFQLYIPDAFTPNGDRLNDVFELQSEGIIHYSMEIYNRWGEMIFSGMEDQGWDGNYRNVPAMSGQYYYRIKVLTERGVKETLTGIVQLLR